jgi:hypothetical protein
MRGPAHNLCRAVAALCHDIHRARRPWPAHRHRHLRRFAALAPIGTGQVSSFKDISFDGVDNKDASVFPVMVPGPFGQPAVGLLHRPLFPQTHPEELMLQSLARARDLDRGSIWISYTNVRARGEEHRLGEFVLHHRLACPEADWECLKIGGGAPPVQCRHGWLAVITVCTKSLSPRASDENCAIRPA